MKSVNFEFGNKGEELSIEKEKGIDWMLDPFLQKKVRGQAGFDYEIVQTRTDIIAEVLNEKYGYDDITRLLQLYKFYTIFLHMNVKMYDPGSWSLSWARFEFELDGIDISVLSFAPNTEGIKTTIEKNGSRDLNLSLSGELNNPLSLDPSDIKISSEISYNNKKGWKVNFDS